MAFFPRRPPELLIKIINLAVPPSNFDFLQADWTQGVHYTTLKALCLASPTLNELASPVLCRHVILPTAEARARFVWTLQWNKWRDRKKGDEVVGWVKQMVMGSLVGGGAQVGGEFVAEVLTELTRLSGGPLDKLALVGLKLGPPVFASMSSE